MADPRYDAIKFMIQKKKITTFSQIYDHIPKTVIRNTIHTSGQRMDRLMKNPSLYEFQEIIALANAIGVRALTLYRLISDEAVEAYKKNPGVTR